MYSLSAFLLFAVISTTVTQYTTEDSGLWCQHNHLRENGFAETQRILGFSPESRLSFKGVEVLLEQLLFRVRCEQKTPQQCQCITAAQLFDTVGGDRSLGFSEDEFNNASLFILPSLDSFPLNCTPGIAPLCGAAAPSKPCPVSHQSLQQLLMRISATYRPGKLSLDADGKVTEENSYSACISVRNKMFNAQTVLLESEVSGSATAADIGRVSALILSKMLRGQCIVPLNQRARSVDFTYAIFHEFGNNSSCTIKKEGWDNLIDRVKSGGKTGSVLKPAKPTNENMHDINDVRKKCFNRSELLAIHQANLSGSGVTREEFIRLAPALLQQLSVVACEDDVTGHLYSDEKLNQAEMYGYGSVIILIISLGTLPGGLFAPFRDTAAYKYILACMMGVAAGTLLGDGVLHLIPDALGLDITQATPAHLTDTLYVAPYKLKMFMTMGAAYLFFVMELIFAYIGMHNEKKKEVISTTFVDPGAKDKYTNGRFAKINGPGEDNELIERRKHVGNDFKELEENTPAEKANSPMSLAYMILIGDAIHNFADGLAVGAALQVGWRSGLSTSIAIFCHEVPHELGDFAALLSVGWSYKKALLMNFVSGLTAFAGLYVGILVSDNLYARQWIFAVTAGMFLYIALSDLVPELLEYFKNYSPLPIFIAENVGFLIGTAIMVVITLYEEHIRI